MLSLRERIDLLESDLRANPIRIKIHNDLPFAILRYEPAEEWEVRDATKKLATRLQQVGKTVHRISLADLMWEVIERTEGLDAVVELERLRGFEAAQEQVNTYLSDRDWLPLPDVLAEKLAHLDPKQDIAFLMRAASMAPGIYHMSMLLDQMQGRTQVPTILFYPGTIEGNTGLRFMGLSKREAMGNYRVKIYG
ncbi:MAG TPA: BREX protein BrxB domain-containing protein [Chloroflexia bacterium]|jgi:hypothetical protein